MDATAPPPWPWPQGGSIALRRGKKIAVVALARRLAGILYAMMRDGTVYRPAPMRPVATTLNPVAVAT